jgi:hypothetical protein
MDEFDHFLDEFYSGAGGEVDECWIMLRFLGDNLEPDSITAMLGVDPTSSCRKGEPPSNGRTGPVPTGYWVLDCERTTNSADHQIQRLLREDLPHDMGIWGSLTKHFVAELKINLLPAKWARGATLSADTIQLLAERGLRLGLDVYVQRPTKLRSEITQ